MPSPRELFIAAALAGLSARCTLQDLIVGGAIDIADETLKRLAAESATTHDVRCHACGSSLTDRSTFDELPAYCDTCDREVCAICGGRESIDYRGRAVDCPECRDEAIDVELTRRIEAYRAVATPTPNCDQAAANALEHFRNSYVRARK